MSLTGQFSITFDIGDRSYGEAKVDDFELKASRRALRNLKTLLHCQPMLDLIHPQIEEADRYFQSVIDASDGRYRECRIDLQVKGLHVMEIMGFRQRFMSKAETAEGKKDLWLTAMAPAHPEHYAFVPEAQDSVIEVIGEHMARIYLDTKSPVPQWVLDYGDPSYPMKKPTIGTLKNGSVLCYILHEFRDTREGADLRLRILFPEKAEEVWFREHAEHLAVEFRTGVALAAKEAGRA